MAELKIRLNTLLMLDLSAVGLVSGVLGEGAIREMGRSGERGDQAKGAIAPLLVGLKWRSQFVILPG